MTLSGEMLIGATATRGTGGVFHARDAHTGAELEPAFHGGGSSEVNRACALAGEAFEIYRETDLEQRALFLERIAENILGLGDALIERTVAESGLPRGRIEGERGRTVGQLRLFAQVVREGSWLGARIDHALPDRKPLPRVDLRMRHIPLGPVAVFGASNFPLAFSVAGGDTASALAAGCPVVVKGHPAHPGTSELVGRAIQAAVAECGLPEGVFSLLVGTENALGAALVADPRIRAVGFTGSRRGGLALMELAAKRPEPIPVYAEMSSINPLFLLPAALASRADSIGRDYVASVSMGAGQFCTNPGLVLALDGPDLNRFIDAAREALARAPAATMLSGAIHAAYEDGVKRLRDNSSVQEIGHGQASGGPAQGEAVLFVTDATSYLTDPHLAEEVFGASSLVVRCPDLQTLRVIAGGFEGQLTVTLQMEEADTEIARGLLPVLERKAGRILVNGYPTGVEVGHAMVHGGPFPATSDGRSTSVGSLAIARFLRPVCYQDMPAALLPASLQEGNPLKLWRRVEGELSRN